MQAGPRPTAVADGRLLGRAGGAPERESCAGIVFITAIGTHFGRRDDDETLYDWAGPGGLA